MAPEETARQKSGAQLVTPGSLNLIRDSLATRLGIPPGDLELPPVNRPGEPGQAHPFFGGQPSRLLDKLNAVLAAPHLCKHDFHKDFHFIKIIEHSVTIKCIFINVLIEF